MSQNITQVHEGLLRQSPQMELLQELADRLEHFIAENLVQEIKSTLQQMDTICTKVLTEESN